MSFNAWYNFLFTGGTGDGIFSKNVLKLGNFILNNPGDSDEYYRLRNKVFLSHEYITEKEKEELCRRFLNDFAQHPCTNNIATNEGSVFILNFMIKDAKSAQNIIDALKGCNFHCQCGRVVNIVNHDNERTEKDDDDDQDDSRDEDDISDEDGSGDDIDEDDDNHIIV